MDGKTNAGVGDRISAGRFRNEWVRVPSAFLLRLLFALVFVLSSVLPATAQTSDVVDLFVQQRIEARIAELLEEIGTHMQARPAIHLGEMTLYRLWMDQNLAHRAAYADSLIAVEEMAAARALAEAAAFGASPVSWRKFAADEQGDFLDRFREVFWRAIATSHPQDTVSTSHFRARLNGLFGAPTRNAAAMEQEEYAGSEYVQFEYWLVANDSIAVLVLDINGPFGHGLLVAADEAYTDDFPVIKNDLFEQLSMSEPTPYADYYHSLEQRQWFRTGFDGTDYFVRETRRPRWATTRSRDEKWRIFR